MLRSWSRRAGTGQGSPTFDAELLLPPFGRRGGIGVVGGGTRPSARDVPHALRGSDGALRGGGRASACPPAAVSGRHVACCHFREGGWRRAPGVGDGDAGTVWLVLVWTTGAVRGALLWMATAPVPEQGCQHEVPQVQEHIAEVAGGQGDATGAVAEPRC